MSLVLLYLAQIFSVMASGSVLKNFLNSGRAAVKSGTCRVVLCIGNEAADADSIVSSLCYGFLKQFSARRTLHSQASPVVPIVSVARSVLELRPETKILLQMVDLELEDLICTEEVDLALLRKTNNIEGLILTDHNSLSSDLSAMFDQEHPHDLLVKEIIDHHIDNQDYAHVQGIARNIAFDHTAGCATVGSTCTIVAEFMMSMKDELDAETRVALGTLLSGVIMIDTQNMRSTGPGTDRDERVLQELLESPAFLHNTIDRSQISEDLRGAKTDPTFWASLTAHQGLVADYKQFRANKCCEFGVSSVACSVADFMKKQRVKEVMADHLADSVGHPRLALLVVMASYEHTEKGFIRELVLASFTPSLLDNILKLPSVLSTLDLIPTTHYTEKEESEDTGIEIRFFTQGNIKASRKQVAPLLQAALKSVMTS